MSTPRVRAARLAQRVADLLHKDLDDPDVYVVDDSEHEVQEDGRTTLCGYGAEAVLIVRGRIEGRSCALRKLLALIK